MSSIRLGKRGEWLARVHLRARGYRIVAVSWRAGRLGEVDLIVRRGRTLAFVEVKTRRGDRFGTALEAVDARKQRRLVRLAEAFLASLPADSPLRGLAPRMDVVAVQRTPGRGWRIRHLPGAFDASSRFPSA